MADLQPNESRPPFQEVPRCYIHVHELEGMIKSIRNVLGTLERLRRDSLCSDRRVSISQRFYRPPNE